MERRTLIPQYAHTLLKFHLCLFNLEEVSEVGETRQLIFRQLFKFT